MAIYTFTCKACHQQIRVKAAQGEALERELCEACALEEAFGDPADFEALEAGYQLDEEQGKRNKARRR